MKGLREHVLLPPSGGESLPIGLADVSWRRGFLQGGFELSVEPENLEGLLSKLFAACLFSASGGS